MLSIGLLRTNYAYSSLPKYTLNESLGIAKVIQGKVVSQIDKRDGYVTFNIEPVLSEMNGYTKRLPLIRVTSDRFVTISYGDVVNVNGRLEMVLSNNETYKSFTESLIRKGVLYEIRFAKVGFVEHSKANFIKKYSEVMRVNLTETINRYVREPSAGFINGILIGEKHGLSKEWFDRFTDVGLTHVIVLSGYNLAVMFAWTRVLFRRTSFIVQNTFGAMSVIMLVLISGAEPPAIRAGILVLIVALAAVFQRQQNTPHFLSVTIIIMLLVSPFYLLYDISFQLSVVATYGLVYIAPILETYVKALPKPLSETARDTLAAQIAVLPLQLFYFGTLSWVAILVNILILPLIPMLMVLGSVVLATNFIPGLNRIFGEITSVISDMVLNLVKIISNSTDPYHISINLLGVIILYIIMSVIALLKYKKE